jgi:type II secretory pathway pseudopilin PulG
MQLSRVLLTCINWLRMSINPPTQATLGFALTEAMVALLLLAFALLGAGAALVESLAAQRTALLQTRAADLASNLAEALRAAPDAEAAAAEIEAWRSTVLLQLPLAEPLAQARDPSPPGVSDSQLPAGFDIRLQWRDPQLRTPAQLVLPLGIRAPAGAG